MKLRDINREKLEHLYIEWKVDNWDTYDVMYEDLARCGVVGASTMSDEELMDWYKDEQLNWK